MEEKIKPNGSFKKTQDLEMCIKILMPISFDPVILLLVYLKEKNMLSAKIYV